METNLYTFRNNGVPIDLVRRIVVVEKRRIPLNMRVNISAPSVLSTPIQDRSTYGEIDRPLQTYANIVAILSERLKTRFCLFYDCEYTLDALRFALPRERTVDLGYYVLLRNDALREGGSLVAIARIQGPSRGPLASDSEARCSVKSCRESARTTRVVRRRREVVPSAADDAHFELDSRWRLVFTSGSHS